MGLLFDEHGDPNSWASCLFCGFATMGEDELEERKEREKQLEREARWCAGKTPKPDETSGTMAMKATPTAVAPVDVPVILHRSAEDVVPIVSEQPRPLKPLPPIPTASSQRSLLRQNDDQQTIFSTDEAPAVEIVDAEPTLETSFTTPSSAKQHDLKERGSPLQPVSCLVCDDGNHAEEDCPRLEGISIQPTKDMTWFTAEDYVALSRRDCQKR